MDVILWSLGTLTVLCSLSGLATAYEAHNLKGQLFSWVLVALGIYLLL